jgi:DnaJ-class molecular chaperone
MFGSRTIIMSTCSVCRGGGNVLKSEYSAVKGAWINTAMTCPICNGTGKVAPNFGGQSLGPGQNPQPVQKEDKNDSQVQQE